MNTLKRQNDEMIVNSVTLEQQLQKQKEKMIGSEEQLRKLEQKVSLSDISLANQVSKPSFHAFATQFSLPDYSNTQPSDNSSLCPPSKYDLTMLHFLLVFRLV